MFYPDTDSKYVKRLEKVVRLYKIDYWLLFARDLEGE
nr:MAG TPA: hypothetical protein [Caudoviricetes sp.]